MLMAQLWILLGNRTTSKHDPKVKVQGDPIDRVEYCDIMGLAAAS